MRLHLSLAFLLAAATAQRSGREDANAGSVRYGHPRHGRSLRVSSRYFRSLDRANQCEPRVDGNWDYVDASGVRVFILSSGIRENHPRLTNYVNTTSDCHYSYFSDNHPSETASPLDDEHGDG